MQKFLFAILASLSLVVHAQEPAEEVPLEPEKPAVTDKAGGDDDLFEKPAAPPAKHAVQAATAAPSATRRPASTVSPQRFVDKELNIACYYIAPSDSMQLTPSGFPVSYAAINCVKLEDPEDKADRELLRKERIQDRARSRAEEQAKEERERSEENQKELQLLRNKKSR